MKKVYIGDNIQHLLVTSKKDKAELFLLGQNENGVITKAIRLPKYLGCYDMPGVSHKALHKAYLDLVEDGFIPMAFGYRTTHDNTMTDADVIRLREMLFICSTGGALTVEKYDEDFNVTQIEVRVVSENFVPKRNTRSTVPARVGSTSSTNKKKENNRGNRKR